MKKLPENFGIDLASTKEITFPSLKKHTRAHLCKSTKQTNLDIKEVWGITVNIYATDPKFMNT